MAMCTSTAKAMYTLDELENSLNERLIAINGKARGYEVAS